MTDETKPAKVRKAARLFDIRRVIGGLFVVYGVIVTLIGLFDSPGEIAKAQGVRINLWMGLAMLAVGALMLLWLWLSPPGGPDDVGPAQEEPAGENREP
jgi:hypothetical protein